MKYLGRTGHGFLLAGLLLAGQKWPYCLRRDLHR
jgi:hypothetical protein